MKQRLTALPTLYLHIFPLLLITRKDMQKLNFILTKVVAVNCCLLLNHQLKMLLVNRQTTRIFLGKWMEKHNKQHCCWPNLFTLPSINLLESRVYFVSHSQLSCALLPLCILFLTLSLPPVLWGADHLLLLVSVSSALAPVP